MQWLRTFMEKFRKPSTQVLIKSFKEDKQVFVDFTVLLSEYFNTYKNPLTRFDVAHLIHLKDHLHAFGDIFVAYHDGMPVGCVVLEAMATRETRPYGSELSRLFVLEQYRGKGIATNLIQQCALRLDEYDERFCFLVVNESDSVVNMYTELGFTIHPSAQNAGSDNVLYLECPTQKLLQNI